MPGSPTGGWYDDPALVRYLPWYFRLYAAYTRVAVSRTSGVVPGGSFLFRVMRRLIRLLGLRHEVPVRFGARVVWVDLSDQRVLWVFDELRGEGPEVRLLEKLLAPGDTFIDVGANHGSFAILAAPMVGRNGRVVAVEPQPILARLVERSLGETGVPFEVHAVALGDAHGTIPLYVPHDGSGAASRFEGYAGRSTSIVNVPVVRADEQLRWRDYPGRLVLKLDVEGSELAFLKGAADLLRERRPHVLFELNAESARAAGHGADRLLTELETSGYRFAELDAPSTTVDAAGVPLTPQRNLLAVPGEA